MRERAEKIGALLQIRSVVGSGTTVELTLPLKNLSANLPLTA
jgi:signal transduction histidine kinase